MADGLSIDIETREVETMLRRLLNRVERPKKLLKNIQRLVHALTMKMFRGRRPDTSGVRGVKWPKLKKSTINAKKAKIKRRTTFKSARSGATQFTSSKGMSAQRPMVDTGETRDSLKILSEDKKGFVYGTKVKSNKGFAYPGHHNKGRFPFIFLRKEDFAQIQRMTIDHLENAMKNFKNYMRT